MNSCLNIGVFALAWPQGTTRDLICYSDHHNMLLSKSDFCNCHRSAPPSKLPALPAGCSDPGVGARSTGKHRSPQTAPRLQGPNIGSNEPGRSPEVMLDAFRASLTWSVELSGSLRSVTLSLFRAGAGASGVVLA